MICAWVVTSSAVVASSAISSFGEAASAIAIITRWRIPPRADADTARALPRGGQPYQLEQLERAVVRGPA